MKLSPPYLLPALCWTVRLASATAGNVYIHDFSESQSAETIASRSLSPVLARLVLAQRAGVEDYHSAELGEDGALEAINDFGRRRSLFAEQERQSQAFVLVEGGLDVEAEIPELELARSFSISPSPNASSAQNLWIDLARQTRPADYSVDASDDTVAEYLHRHMPGEGFYITDSAKDVHALLDMLHNGELGGLTIYSAPSTLGGSVEDETNPWGTYPMPNAQSPLRKRSARSPQQKETPLEVAPNTSNFQSVESSTNTPFHPFASNNSTPLPGILPACYPSQSTCESTTLNCTSHGICTKKYTDQSSSPKSSFKDCYACQCSATKQTASDGKVKTTYWGGPACQKKDVSVEFWMLALFSVGLVFLVGFAVGELAGMGGEELPSVIGAGVSGPVRK